MKFLLLFPPEMKGGLGTSYHPYLPCCCSTNFARPTLLMQADGKIGFFKNTQKPDLITIRILFSRAQVRVKVFEFHHTFGLFTVRFHSTHAYKLRGSFMYTSSNR